VREVEAQAEPEGLEPAVERLAVVPEAQEQEAEALPPRKLKAVLA